MDFRTNFPNENHAARVFVQKKFIKLIRPRFYVFLGSRKGGDFTIGGLRGDDVPLEILDLSLEILGW